MHARHLGVAHAVTGLAVFLVAAMSTPAHAGSVVYVDDDAPAGGDGSSWTTAYRFLQDAFAEAAGDPGITEIRVGQGTYKPDQDEAGNVRPGDREATFQLISGVDVIGGFAGLGHPNRDDRDVEIFETILSGDLAGDDGPQFENNDENTFQVFTAVNILDATLSGFTLTSGNAAGSFPSDSGGALFGDHSALAITHCLFRGNSANRLGGAILLNNGSTVTMADCTLEGNRSLGGSGQGGGAVVAFDSQLLLLSCRIRDNSTSGVAAGIGAATFGGETNELVLVNCSITNNSADLESGGVLIQGLLAATFVNCTIRGNEALDAEWGFGGGIRVIEGAELHLSNTLITGNHAQVAGGGIHGNGNLTVVNCTIGGNAAGENGGGMVDGGAVSNSILWDNSPDQISGSPMVSFSDIEGGFPGTGNIDADPLFVDPDNSDFRLLPGSPCIDAGDNTTVPIEITTDLDGNPRFVDDPGTPDTGNPGPPGPIVDMGAYEFQLPCPWDLNGDGVVNVLDLIELVMSFGPCEDCSADIDDDGIVNVLDLIALIMNFGPCPGTPCVWDVNGDGIVDQLDLQAVTSNLGPCDDPEVCPWDINGDGVVNGQDVGAVATHFGPCP